MDYSREDIFPEINISRGRSGVDVQNFQNFQNFPGKPPTDLNRSPLATRRSPKPSVAAAAADPWSNPNQKASSHLPEVARAIHHSDGSSVASGKAFQNDNIPQGLLSSASSSSSCSPLGQRSAEAFQESADSVTGRGTNYSIGPTISPPNGMLPPASPSQRGSFGRSSSGRMENLASSSDNLSGHNARVSSRSGEQAGHQHRRSQSYDFSQAPTAEMVAATNARRKLLASGSFRENDHSIQSAGNNFHLPGFDCSGDGCCNPESKIEPVTSKRPSILADKARASMAGDFPGGFSKGNGGRGGMMVVGGPEQVLQTISSSRGIPAGSVELHGQQGIAVGLGDAGAGRMEGGKAVMGRLGSGRFRHGASGLERMQQVYEEEESLQGLEDSSSSSGTQARHSAASLQLQSTGGYPSPDEALRSPLSRPLASPLRPRQPGNGGGIMGGMMMGRNRHRRTQSDLFQVPVVSPRVHDLRLEVEPVPELDQTPQQKSPPTTPNMGAGHSSHRRHRSFGGWNEASTPQSVEMPSPRRLPPKSPSLFSRSSSTGEHRTGNSSPDFSNHSPSTPAFAASGSDGGSGGRYGAAAGGRGGGFDVRHSPVFSLGNSFNERIEMAALPAPGNGGGKGAGNGHSHGPSPRGSFGERSGDHNFLSGGGEQQGGRVSHSPSHIAHHESAHHANGGQQSPARMNSAREYSPIQNQVHSLAELMSGLPSEGGVDEGMEDGQLLSKQKDSDFLRKTGSSGNLDEVLMPDHFIRAAFLNRQQSAREPSSMQNSAARLAQYHHRGPVQATGQSSKGINKRDEQNNVANSGLGGQQGAQGLRRQMSANFVQKQNNPMGVGHAGPLSSMNSGNKGTSLMKSLSQDVSRCVRLGSPDDKDDRFLESGLTGNPIRTREKNPWQVVGTGNMRWVEFILRTPYEDIKKYYSVSANKIGSGRYGMIRTCLDRSTREVMACKTIRKDNIKCMEDAEDIRTEVIILGMLRGHPHIVNLCDAFEDPKYVHLVMELCRGGDLFDRVKTRGQFSERNAAMVCHSLAEALLHCQSKGIIHRDIKPENILLCDPDSDCKIKLIDFGVATFFERGVPECDRAGTVEYVAPEVLDKSYGPEADIWSAGVVLYILLCGFPPFWASSNAALEAAIRKAHVDFRHPRWAAVSAPAKDVVMRMLTKDPRARITAMEILSHPWILAHSRGKRND